MNKERHLMRCLLILLVASAAYSQIGYHCIALCLGVRCLSGGCQGGRCLGGGWGCLAVKCLGGRCLGGGCPGEDVLLVDAWVVMFGL